MKKCKSCGRDTLKASTVLYQPLCRPSQHSSAKSQSDPVTNEKRVTQSNQLPRFHKRRSFQSKPKLKSDHQYVQYVKYKFSSHLHSLWVTRDRVQNISTRNLFFFAKFQYSRLLGVSYFLNTGITLYQMAKAKIITQKCLL